MKARRVSQLAQHLPCRPVSYARDELPKTTSPNHTAEEDTILMNLVNVYPSSRILGQTDKYGGTELRNDAIGRWFTELH